MDGDTNVTISWHMKMPGDKHQKTVKAKLHIARIKEIHGYRHVYIDINGYKGITVHWHMHA